MGEVEDDPDSPELDKALGVLVFNEAEVVGGGDM